MTYSTIQFLILEFGQEIESIVPHLTMPRLLLCILLSIALANSAVSEEVTVFGVIQTENGDISLVGKVGLLNTGSKKLMTIVKDYDKTSWTSEPFYGPVTKFAFRDESAQWFIVHFEFIEGHKMVGEGLRFAIAPMTPVSGKKGNFRGEPYNGSSVTEEAILKQLRVLAKEMKGEKK